MTATPRIALTPGEPAGIGPDLAVILAQKPHAAELVAIGDPHLLATRAGRLGLPLSLHPFDTRSPASAQTAGTLGVVEVKARAPVQPGRLDPANGAYVLETLERAADGCTARAFDALVTGPVQKSVINDAGFAFSGHTEFLAERTGGSEPVMMLAAGSLRVALATTHLPLRAVADRITRDGLTRTVEILHNDLQRLMGIAQPRILVAGLNPHAGEGGHLGREEIDVIVPVLDTLRERGLDLTGPLPADTLFTPKHLDRADAVLAMYHDQGLPVIKHHGFGRTVNVTLGLPIVRTSVDHGTALDLAGTGRVDPGSLEAAVAMAIELSHHAK